MPRGLPLPTLHNLKAKRPKPLLARDFPRLLPCLQQADSLQNLARPSVGVSSWARRVEEGGLSLSSPSSTWLQKSNKEPALQRGASVPAPGLIL